MKQREQYVVREMTTTGRKDYENSRKSMQSTGTWEMDVFRSPLNPEEMDTIQSCSRTSQAWASRRRSMEKIRCVSTQQWIQEKRLFLNQLVRNTE